MPVLGLMVVGRKGGVAKQVVISVEGVPFQFTNALDIDQNTEVVYFTDTITIFQRWYVSSIYFLLYIFKKICKYSYDSHSHLLTMEFFKAYVIAMQTGDKTGRLLKYDQRTKEVTVLLRGLSFSNGVALNKDNDFVLVTKTTIAKVTRYWLKVKNLKPMTLLYNSLDVEITFKETLVGNFGLHKITMEDDNSKLSR